MGRRQWDGGTVQHPTPLKLNWISGILCYSREKLTQKPEHAPCFWTKHKTSRSHQFLQTFWGVYLFYSKKRCSQRHGFRLVGRSDGCLPAVGFNHTWTPEKADHVGGWESQHEKLSHEAVFYQVLVPLIWEKTWHNHSKILTFRSGGLQRGFETGCFWERGMHNWKGL